MSDDISETAGTWVDDTYTGEMDNTFSSWADEMEVESENWVQKEMESDIPVQNELELDQRLNGLSVDNRLKETYDLVEFEQFLRVLKDEVSDTDTLERTYSLVDFIQFMTMLDNSGMKVDLVDFTQCTRDLQEEVNDTEDFIMVSPLVPTVKGASTAMENQKVAQCVEGESSSNYADSLDSDAESDYTPLKTDGLPEPSTTTDLDQLANKFLVLSNARHAKNAKKISNDDKPLAVQDTDVHEVQSQADQMANSSHAATQTDQELHTPQLVTGHSRNRPDYGIQYASPMIGQICASLNSLTLELQDVKRSVANLQTTKTSVPKDRPCIERDKPICDSGDEPSEELDSVQLTLYNFRRAINEMKIDIQSLRSSINIVDSNAVAREFNRQLKNVFTGTNKDNLCILRRWDGVCPPMYPKTLLDAKGMKYDELVKMLGFYGFDIDSEQEDELDMKRKLLAFLGCPAR
ncbi:hypothetical protein V1520DRAFT_392731 [Lipomyces starkeyi]|uniref:Uncharacterized protein n=1 Tax=Lipomyces starkeyi NRRL Y-11557 TaxID=675824 RepID=A0A1E3Q2F9_LIPST|nr:hypothetical protein LIPSTDRAFT_4968 [Lipomyces starkeyi NRRL Y-11557]